MTSKLPKKRLADVLKLRTQEAAKDSLKALVTTQTTLPIRSSTSLYEENELLVSYDRFHQLCEFPFSAIAQSNPLGNRLLKLPSEKIFLWGIYKPPFVPQRISEASNIKRKGNFHKVSVEEYMHRVHCKAVKRCAIHVLYDVGKRESGVQAALISANANNRLFEEVAQIRAACAMTFDVIVHGHCRRVVGEELPITLFYPKLNAEVGANFWLMNKKSEAAGKFGRAANSSYSVVKHGYYGVFPVSLVNVQIMAPPFSAAPQMRTFASAILRTHIVGDTSGTLFETKTDEGTEANPFEFPRYMVHLRKLTIFNTCPEDASSASQVQAEFSCSRAISQLVRPAINPHENKVRAIDGQWAPV